LAEFLDSSQWPIGDDFAERSLAYAFYRQAHCAAQYGTCDVFYKLKNIFPVHEVKILEELATKLFRI
jgi:hypothetical protein